MNKYLAFFSIISILALTSTVAAEGLPEEKNTDRIDLELREAGFLDRFTGNLLSVSFDQTSVEQGDEVTGSIYGDIGPVDDRDVSPYCNGDNVEIKIDWFDPSGQNVATDYLSASECQSYFVDYSFNVWDDAELGEWEVQAEYRHEDVADLTGPKVYDFGSDTYDVVDSTTDDTTDDGTGDSTDDGTDDSTTTEPDPDISTYRETDVSVSGNEISTTAYLENNGGDMQEEWLVELNPKQQESFLSFFSFTSQDTCDPDNEKAVHRKYQLDSGESTSFTLTSSVEDGNYDVMMTSTDGCANLDSSVGSTKPFGWGTTVDNVDIGSSEPAVSAYKDPSISVDGKKVTGTVYLENTGASMSERNIVEMQIKTPDNRFLSFVGGQDVCDSDHPENVHKEYRLDNGAEKAITLESEVPEAGTYDIVFLTVDQCAADGGSYEFVDPYKGYQEEFRFTDVTVGDTSTGTDPGEGVDEGENSLPIVPILLTAGVVTLLGGVYIKWV